MSIFKWTRFLLRWPIFASSQSPLAMRNILNKHVDMSWELHCAKSVRIRSYSVGMLENADQNNSKYGHFSRSVALLYKGVFIRDFVDGEAKVINKKQEIICRFQLMLLACRVRIIQLNKHYIRMMTNTLMYWKYFSYHHLFEDQSAHAELVIYMWHILKPAKLRKELPL